MRNYDDTRIGEKVFEEWVEMLEGKLSDLVYSIAADLNDSYPGLFLGSVATEIMYRNLRASLHTTAYDVAKAMVDVGLLDDEDALPESWNSRWPTKENVE